MTETIRKISEILSSGGRNSKPVVLKELENGCIVCISHKLGDKGYLRLGRGGKSVGAHRIVYEAFYGPIRKVYILKLTLLFLLVV